MPHPRFALRASTSCPHCGKAAEVYSRITGYYRPVQNWNDGKSQEYRERREYDVEHHSTGPGAKERKRRRRLHAAAR